MISTYSINAKEIEEFISKVRLSHFTISDLIEFKNTLGSIKDWNDRIDHFIECFELGDYIRDQLLISEAEPVDIIDEAIKFQINYL